MITAMRFIDLECGIGGFALGIKSAGHELLFATDHCNHFLETFRWNFNSIKALDRQGVSLLDVPHPDVACGNIRNDAGAESFSTLLRQIMPRVVLLEAEKVETSWILDLGYKPYYEKLDALDFGLPQKRKKDFVVAFRNDIKPKFLAFPFPEGGKRSFLCDILEPAPDSKLSISRRVLERTDKRNQKNHEKGLGFRTRTFTPSDVLPCLSPRYVKDKTEFFVQGPSGPRRISVLEAKRAMGFPDDFVMPVSESAAFGQLFASTCPAVAEALVREVADWIF